MEAIVNFQNIPVHNFKKWRKSLRYHSNINLWSLKPLLQVGFSATWHSSVHKLSFSKLLEALFGRSFMRFFSTRSWWVSQHIGKSYFRHIKHKLGLVALGAGTPIWKRMGVFVKPFRGFKKVDLVPLKEYSPPAGVCMVPFRVLSKEVMVSVWCFVICTS